MSGMFERRPVVGASGDGAVAAQGDIGVAVTGDGAIGTVRIDHATVLPAGAYRPAASVAWPPGLTNLPERPTLFVGRERELALLDAALASPGGAVVHAVHGLGGIGKSTLAARWAADRARRTPVWWITAESPASVDAGLAALAGTLQPALTTLLQQRQLRDWALQWLTAHDDWLVVLDNVSDPADLKPLLAATTGRFLITSRRATGWHGIAEPISLDVLDPAEAADLFTRICPTAGDGTAEVCAELGHLPLAVEQAAAYCAETGATARDYLDLLADYPAHMYTATAEGGDIQRTVARVWRLTLDRIADDPLAVTILLALAWYAPDGIPRTLLDTLGARPAVHRAVGRLAAHSMLTLHGATPHGTTLSVHRLVQAVARTPDPDDPHRAPGAVAQAREIAAESLAESLPTDADDPAGWPAWRTLLPHVEAMAEHCPQDADPVELARAVSRMGAFMSGQGMSQRALRFLGRGAAGLLRHLGPDHPSVLIARNRMVTREPLPVPEAERHLADCERVLGPRHPETLTARYELAGACLKADETERAGRIVEHVVKLRTRVLGAGHPGTFEARTAGAMILARAGNLAGAVDGLQRTIADSARALGETHPATLDARGRLSQVSNLDSLLGDAGAALMSIGNRLDETDLTSLVKGFSEYVDPEQTQEWARREVVAAKEQLADCERVLGPGHLETIQARLTVAQLCVFDRDVDGAIEHAERSAEDAARHLGPDDAATLSARGILLLMHLMRQAEAQGAFDVDDALESARNVLGGDSPAFHELVRRAESIRASMDMEQDAEDAEADGGEGAGDGAARLALPGASGGDPA
ncbi:tetratricopeptide repeat protein [Streptomyces sp. NPDC091292]|uniref:tetratricopeptide repeat protein n=1 Tax=Streptomyces sp. NPDC091292 TaxID=3365991 RepID=UPI003800074E